MAGIENLRTRIVDAGLGAYADLIVSRLVPAIGLRTRLPVEGDLDVGATRFGGEPDVPDSFVWPEGGHDPVFLVAQLRLRDLAPFDTQKVLPKTGLLSIFAEASGWPACVRYFADDVPLARRSLPANSAALLAETNTIQFRASGATIEPHLHVPESIEWPADGPLDPREAAERYEAVRDAWMRELFPSSQPVVGGMGLVPGTPAVHQLLGELPSEASYADTADEEPIGENMRVLLGIDSDCLVGMEFGDAQRVWLLVDRADLAARDFSRIRCAL